MFSLMPHLNAQVAWHQHYKMNCVLLILNLNNIFLFVLFCLSSFLSIRKPVLVVMLASWGNLCRIKTHAARGSYSYSKYRISIFFLAVTDCLFHYSRPYFFWNTIFLVKCKIAEINGKSQPHRAQSCANFEQLFSSQTNISHHSFTSGWQDDSESRKHANLTLLTSERGPDLPEGDCGKTCQTSWRRIR